MTIALSDLTQVTLDGSGVFDVLMRANKVHLEAEYAAGRIRGPEYSQVYLGSLTAVLQQSMQFLLTKDKIALEAQLMEQQVLVAQAEVLKANAAVLQVEAQTRLVEQQTANALAELAIITANAAKVPAEVALLGAQKDHTIQQTANLASQKLQIEGQTLLIAQQRENALKEGLILDAQKCKLDQELLLVIAGTAKTTQETALLAQKTATEQAQTQPGADPDSIVGKQKALYFAQAEGFKRDAEQKAANILVSTWNTRRMTDESTVAGTPPGGVNNMLGDANIAKVVYRLMEGVGANEPIPPA